MYVGYGEGSLGIINATNGEVIRDIKLGAHPESFQIEDDNKLLKGHRSRIFINLPDSNSIIIVDKQKGITLTAWSIPDASNNFPMDIDQANHACLLVPEILQS